MGVMALDAIHFAFKHGMVLWRVEFGLGLEVALEAGSRVPAGIYNKDAPTAASLNVFAARPVAGFASGLTSQDCGWGVDAGVGTGLKSSRDVRVAVVTCLVADVLRARNF